MYIESYFKFITKKEMNEVVCIEKLRWMEQLQGIEWKNKTLINWKQNEAKNINSRVEKKQTIYVNFSQINSKSLRIATQKRVIANKMENKRKKKHYQSKKNQ